MQKRRNLSGGAHENSLTRGPSVLCRSLECDGMLKSADIEEKKFKDIESD